LRKIQENNLSEWITIFEAMQVLDLEKSEFIAFVENNHINKYDPLNSGVKSNKTNFLYKIAEIFVRHKTYIKENYILLTRKEAQEVVRLKRTSFFKFIEMHNIKPFMPLNSGGERHSGTIQLWRKQDLFAAIDNSKVHSDIPTK